MSSDGFREGYDKGRQDAEQQKNRDLRPKFVKAVASEEYRKTYTEGYTTGYRDGKREPK